MRIKKLAFSTIGILLTTLAASVGHAQEVTAQISTREAYVGQPIVLQIQIANASDFEQPTTPKIDGCDVRSTGAPSQSSQLTIINGRRSESRSITMQYLITPRRAGTFEIPAITVEVDGRQQQTRPMRFVATKSETGDLLFVEVEGKKDKVFVGQPLDLTLKIWIKPFRDRDNRITLSEANMWQLISEQTSWGVFADRLAELAENNQRPAGKEVLRDDGQGNERGYYLYEIDATIYPTRSGKIDGDDLQIVLNYPTELGKSRDPFAGFFEDSPFGRSPMSGSSLMKQMMDDDFFSSSFGGAFGSPFGNRLSVSKYRPLVANATVDSTEIVPVPTEGRPADYRGAVGQYEIVTRATPTDVAAGDPITLNIGIVGTGPMELVQAPPLTENESLTSDFKVADQSLAGFVQDETKVFSTTIRPRREGITTIPPIPFSFFDPKSEQFQTVVSKPISITVEKAESLSLDSIVGNAKKNDGADLGTTSATVALPDFTNYSSNELLVAESRPTSSGIWIWIVGVPPIIWLASLILFHRKHLSSWLPSFQSGTSRCLARLFRSSEPAELVNSLVDFVARKTGKKCDGPIAAVGALRTSGLYETANSVESYFHECERASYRGDDPQKALDQLKQRGVTLVEQLDSAFASQGKKLVRRKARRSWLRLPAAGRKSQAGKTAAGSHSHEPSHFAGILVLATCGLFANPAIASESANQTNGKQSAVSASLTSELSESQRETIAKEANALYQRAIDLEATDSAESKDLFGQAATKYQMLADRTPNSKLNFNLGNAYLKSGDVGRAIASYERARRLDPSNYQIFKNLEVARSLVNGPADQADSTEPTSIASMVETIGSWNRRLHASVGSTAMLGILSVAAILFWGCLIARSAGVRFPIWRIAAVPLIVVALVATSFALAERNLANDFDAVAVVQQLEIRTGDGQQFGTLATIKPATGHRLDVIRTRGDWHQVHTPSGISGWVDSNAIEIVRAD